MKQLKFSAFIILALVATSLSLAETPNFDLLNTQSSAQSSPSQNVYMPPNITTSVDEPTTNSILENNLRLAEGFLSAAQTELNKGIDAALDGVDNNLARANMLLVEYFVVMNEHPQSTSADKNRMIELFQQSHQLRTEATKVADEQFDNLQN